MAKRKYSQSPQARWSRKKKKQGRCARCGEPRGKYKQLCDFHQGQFTAYMREYRAKTKGESHADHQGVAPAGP